MIGTKDQIIEWLQDKKEDSIFDITQKRSKTIRSLAQNRYYWIILDIISDFHGYTPVEAHNIIKKTVGIETTTDLDTGEFAFMINMIRDIWNTQFGCYIPLPNEVEELKSLEKYFY